MKLTLSLLLLTIVLVTTAAGLLRHKPVPVDSTTRLEVELITLRANGFEPLRISRPKGPFVLILEDRSGNNSSSFALQRVNGERLRDVPTSRMKYEWHDVMNLAPGDYLLTNTNSNSNCQITILP